MTFQLTEKMFDNEASPETVVTSLEDSLKDMPKFLRIFSLAMRALYSDQNVGTSTEAARKFTELRDNTRDDAKLYVKVILPLTINFVSSIEKFFEFYEFLSYEEWCEMLPDILEDVKTHKEFAETLRDTYEKFMVPLKKREDEAKMIITEFKSLQSEYEKMTNEFADKAETKCKWAFGLAFIPGVNLIASSLLRLYANEDTAKEIAKRAESKTHGAASLTVAKILIPALSNFIDGLTKATGFFEVMEKELESFQKKAEESKVSDKESLKKIHYKMLSAKTKKINLFCHTFYAALPAVRTDFEAIPDEDTEQNYIDKWLEEKLTEIRKKRESTQKAFVDALEGIEGICLKLPKHFLLSLKPANTS